MSKEIIAEHPEVQTYLGYIIFTLFGMAHTIIAYFIKKWMGDREREQEQDRIEYREAVKKLAEDTRTRMQMGYTKLTDLQKEVGQLTTKLSDISVCVKDLREHFGEIKKDLKEIGRTNLDHDKELVRVMEKFLAVHEKVENLGKVVWKKDG